MAKPQQVTFLKTAIDDKPGAMLGVAQLLKGRKLSLTGMWGYATREGRADLFLIAKNPEKLRAALSAEGMPLEQGTAFFLKGTDTAGALVKTMDALAGAGVNVIAMNAVAVSGKFGSFIWVADADVAKTAAALGRK